MSIISTEKSQSLPESLTLGGVVYKVSENPELKDFIGQIAKVEKSKLYSQIEELRTGMEELKKVQILPSEPAAPAAAPSTSGLTAEQLVDVVTKVVSQQIEPLKASILQQKTESLEEYRERLIADNESICIPEMVKGTTREELLSSLEESVRIRAKYNTADFNKPGGLESSTVPTHVTEAAQLAQENAVVAQIRQPETPAQPVVTQPVQTAQAQPAPVAEQPVNTNVIAPMSAPAIVNDGGLSAVKNMSPEEFAANRKSLEEKLKTTVG